QLHQGDPLRAVCVRSIAHGGAISFFLWGNEAGNGAWPPAGTVKAGKLLTVAASLCPRPAGRYTPAGKPGGGQEVTGDALAGDHRRGGHPHRRGNELPLVCP